jgi:hypothetical protein
LNLRHGKLNTYKRDGCRCDLCKEVGSKYNATRYRPRPRLPLAPILACLDESKKTNKARLEKTYGETGVTIGWADRFCISMGKHPWEVYGDLWFQDLWDKEKKKDEKSRTRLS